MQLHETHIWRETIAAPATLRSTIDAAYGTVDGAVDALKGCSRLVITGNGAAWYTGLTVWFASLSSSGPVPEVLTVPAGLLASGTVTWRPGDALLVVSTSGELRDVVQLLDAGIDVPIVAITATPTSTIGRAAQASLLTTVKSQAAVTHTQSYLGNITSALLLWARLSNDDGLTALVESADQTLAAAIAACPSGPIDDKVVAATTAVVAGTGPAWVAAQEGALLLGEVAEIPTQGMETREAATTGMYALGSTDLFVSMPTAADDPLLIEAEEVCAERGATVIRLGGGEVADRRLSTLTTFPAAVSLATRIGLARGLDVDQPSWLADYYRTARA